MPITRTDLKLYKNITSGTDDKTQSHIPATGEFVITSIDAEAAFDLNCAVKVLFDGAIVWFTKGASKHTKNIVLTGDGVKKVELVLDANDLPSGSVLLGGHVKIEQET